MYPSKTIKSIYMRATLNETPTPTKQEDCYSTVHQCVTHLYLTLEVPELMAGWLFEALS